MVSRKRTGKKGKKGKKSKKGGAGEVAEAVAKINGPKNIESKICPSEKPICVKKNSKNQYVNCSYEGETSNPIEELTYAWEAGKPGGKIDNFDSSDKEQFCTHFDYVWLTNINAAKKILDSVDLNNKNINTKKLSDEDKEKIDETKPFDSVKFIETYIKIAKQKWNSNDANNAKKIIAALEKTKQNLSTFLSNQKVKQKLNDTFEVIQIKIKEEEEEEEESKSSINNIDATKKAEIKDDLSLISKLFDIGKYVILDERQIDDAAFNTINDTLNEINEILVPEPEPNTSGGRRKRKTYKYKGYKKGRKTQKRKNRQAGGGFTIGPFAFDFKKYFFLTIFNSLTILPYFWLVIGSFGLFYILVEELNENAIIKIKNDNMDKNREEMIPYFVSANTTDPGNDPGKAEFIKLKKNKKKYKKVVKYFIKEYRNYVMYKYFKMRMKVREEIKKEQEKLGQTPVKTELPLWIDYYMPNMKADFEKLDGNLELAKNTLKLNDVECYKGFIYFLENLRQILNENELFRDDIYGTHHAGLGSPYF